jgi:hypothetical protein
MSMTSIAQVRGGAVHPETNEDQMQQIRELLVGEILRRTEARLEQLEGQLKALEGEIGRGLDALAARIETVGAEAAAGQQAAFENLSRSVVELGERIRGLSQS